MARKITREKIEDTEKLLLKMKKDFKAQEQKKLNKKTAHKTDCRIYLTDEQKAYLHLIADEQGISVNRLILNLIEKKYPVRTKAKHLLQKQAVPVPPTSADPDRSCIENRLNEINQILQRAYSGEKLPPDEYHKLKKEKNTLKKKLEGNNSKDNNGGIHV